MKTIRPTVFPSPGLYHTPKVHLNLMTPSKDSDIYYTLDGSTPTKESLKFNINDGLLSIEAQADKDKYIEKEFIIKAFATKKGFEDSEVVTFKFTIGLNSMKEYFYTVLQEKEPGVPAIIRIEDFYCGKMYLVIGEKRGLFIDAGSDMYGNLKGLLDELTQGLPYDTIITHAHPDHVMQAQNLIDLGVKTYMSKLELDTLRKFNLSLEGFEDICDGHIFDLGDCSLKTYHVPGHTLGQMVILDEKNGNLFSSDAFGNNRNTFLDTAFLQLGGEESTMDRYISVIQNFRYKTKGKVKKMFFGHNSNVLSGDYYFEQLEKLVQRIIDNGERVLEPTMRPAVQCMGSSKMCKSGNYISDLYWLGINVKNLFSNNYNEETISTLSSIFVEDYELDKEFQPYIEEYTLKINKQDEFLNFKINTTSSRAKEVKINNKVVGNKEFCKIDIKNKKFIEILIVAPNGRNTSKYNITLDRS